MSASTAAVLPGEVLPKSILPIPPQSNKTLQLGAGLRHIQPSTVIATQAGTLETNARKHGIWVETNTGRYIPQTGDLVIATIHHSAAEIYQCSITPYTSYAQLPQLAFEGATKKTRPQLSYGSLVYARVASASKHFDPELICYSATNGKSEGMGELKGGAVFDVSVGMSRRLLAKKQESEGGIAVLEALAEKVAFEIAVGRNGKVWVKGGEVRVTLLVGKAIQRTDREGLGLVEQRKLARKLLRGS